MMPLPLLADFALRLSCGLAVLLLATPWRLVPPAFFRTHCQVILGLLVLAALDLSRRGATGPGLAVVIVAALLSYFASIAWGLGLPRLGLPLTALIASACAWTLVASLRTFGYASLAVAVSERLASALLLGSTLTAMLLGHHYLTAPAMSIAPLRRFVLWMAGALAARALLAAVSLAAGHAGHVATTASVPWMDLAMRWGIGLVGPAIATALTWETVKIRSTQSATGILYIAFALVLIGELTARG